MSDSPSSDEESLSIDVNFNDGSIGGDPDNETLITPLNLPIKRLPPISTLTNEEVRAPLNRRLGIFEQEGLGDIYDDEDFYLKEISTMIGEAKDGSKTNTRWANIFKYTNKASILLVISLAVIISIVSLTSSNYIVSVLSIAISAIVSIHTMFKIGDIGKKYKTNVYRYNLIYQELFEAMTSPAADSDSLRQAAKKAREKLNEIENEIFQDSYGPSNLARVVNSTRGGERDEVN